MKKFAARAGLASFAVALLATTSLATAQPHNTPGQRDGRGPGQHSPGPGHAGPGKAGPGHRPAMNPPRAHGPQYRPGGPDVRGQRGAGPNHNWYRGARVPPQYRTNHYVVNDWRGHRLSAPPRGYHWVQNGSDYLLIAVATGVIAQLILGN